MRTIRDLEFSNTRSVALQSENSRRSFLDQLHVRINEHRDGASFRALLASDASVSVGTLFIATAVTVTDVATAVGIKASVPPIRVGVEESAGNILHLFGAHVASPIVDVSVLGVSQVTPEAAFAHPRAAAFLWARLLDARGANKNAAAGNVRWLGQIRLE